MTSFCAIMAPMLAAVFHFLDGKVAPGWNIHLNSGVC
jgi:hypothetical protein